MSKNCELYQSFFSYSHLDALSDPTLIENFTELLERRVNARLTNTRFSIWTDKSRLKSGFKWNDRIIDAIKASKIMIVLMTPKWIDSEYCRKEFNSFLEVESSFDVGEYVAPILVRTLHSQIKHFTDDQRKTYNDLSDRQYTQALARDFLLLSSDDRGVLLEKIADDIEGMIERHRAIAREPALAHSERPKRTRKRLEFDSKAHNFERVEIVSSAEIEIEARNGIQPRAILAHIGFTPRMYIQTSTIRIEFGVRRALLSIEASDGTVSRAEDWDNSNPERSAYYIRLRDAPEAVTLCINPSGGNYTLQELPLQPSVGENRFFKFAYAASSTNCLQLTARLTIDLSPEGLYIFGDLNSKPSVSLMKKIAAITSIAIEKEAAASSGKIERVVPIKERAR